MMTKSLLLFLNSYVNIGVENTMKKYKELEKKESWGVLWLNRL
jgi:hypothetical protein